MAAESVKAAVFFEDAEERKLAEKALSAKPGELTVFNGVVEGWAAPKELEQLAKRGLVVEPLDEQTAAPPGKPDTAPSPELLADFKQRAEPAEEDEGEEVYYVDLRGPITKEQRLEFDSFGVNITAFEPPNRYRTFLTSDQLAKARQLPYVAKVTRYGFEDTVTPNLLDAVSRAQAAGGPALLAERGDSEPRRFDCLLHREGDLKRICKLIEEAEGTKVIDTSNLRVRFEAPLDAPLLAAIAALPEVRKLAPFEPPKLL